MLTKSADSLPQKDAQAFKQLAKFHDSKNYKKGLKHAQQLLAKHPEHPETISMKALFELGLGQQNKALQTAKVGLMKSKMKSMFCWHTMGTIYKQKRDYLESSKCFQNAYRFEPDNIQLLKDIAAMQVQIRDHSAHVQTRLSILKLKPNMIHNWTAFTVANHLKGDYDEMFKAFKSMNTLLLAAEIKPVELSHFYIYKAVACRDAQKYDIMYETLQKNKDKIKDEVIWHQLCLQSSLKLGKTQEAHKYLEFLIKKFPENVEYMHQYQKIHDIKTLKQLYAKMNSQFGSKIAKILYVSVLDQKQEFTKQFIELIKPYYKKNLVSLFAEIQVIYESESVKRQWIEEVLESFYENLKSKTQYPDGQQAISPSEYLWSLYILAQHYGLNFQTLQKAHDFIRQAIAHTNTVSEFYIVKAQLEYKMHNNIEALQTINEARKTDLADRYMNNICVKYLFRCLKPNTAEEVMRLFMRDQANAYELQNHWYIIEAGKSLLKRRELDGGLSHMKTIFKQFGDMQSNEFDFHYYCFRKWTLRQYTELVAFNDNIFADKKFIESAYYAIKYLREYSEFIKADEEKKKEQENADNQAKKKNKKKKNKQNQAEELSPLEALRKKIDYYGKQYRETVGPNPMEEALRWSKNVVSAKFVNKKNLRQNKLYAQANLEAISVFIHFDKPLLVLKSFKRVLKANSNEFDTKLMTLRVLTYFEKVLSKNETPEITKQVLKEFISETLGGKTSNIYKEEIINHFKSKNNYLSDIKVKECQLIVKNEETRENFITLYKQQLEALIATGEKIESSLQLVLYLVHKLEYYGEFSAQFKTKLNSLLCKRTSYFSNWVENIDKLPESTWTMWWLSQYDIQREELEALETEASDANRQKSKN